MILTKGDRAKLQESIHGELQKIKNQSIENQSPEAGFLIVISALISDFEELENVLSATYGIFASGKGISEVLSCLSDVLSPGLIEKLNFEGHFELIQNLSLLANSARELKLTLACLHENNCGIAQ